MLTAARQLLPTLQGNTKELDKYLGLVRRVSTLNQFQGVEGAAFSINEALVSNGSDLVSLAERFNISRRAVQAEIRANGGDLAAALDTVLNRMGVTEEAATKLGKTFGASLVAARDAAVQLLAAGFTPLLQALTPILQGTTQLLNTLTSSNPIVGQLTSGFLASATAGIALVLTITNITNALVKMRQAQLLGGAGGRIGGIATAGLIGANLGLAAGNAIRGARGEEPTNFAMVGQNLKAAYLWVVSSFRDAANAIDRVMGPVQDAIRTQFGRLVSMLGSVISAIASVLPPGFGGPGAKDALAAQGAAAQATGEAMQGGDLNQRQAEAKIAGRDRAYSTMREFLGPWEDAAGDSAAEIAAVEAQMAQNRVDSIVQWAKDADRIEKEAAASRTAAFEDFTRQQAETIRNFGIQQGREQEDWGIEEARQLQGHEDQKANIRSDAREQEALWEEELGDSIAKKRQDSNEKLADIEEDYQKERMRAAEDHRDKLFDAAGRLDAAAVAEEQRRFARSEQRAGEDHQDKLDKERESLSKSIAEEEAANDKRVEKARRAEERRLTELDAAFAKQQELEVKDRDLRNRRANEDHARSLADQEAAYQLRVAQINRQEAEALAANEQANRDRLAELGVRLESERIVEENYQKAALARWAAYYGALEEADKQFMEGRLKQMTRPQIAPTTPSIADPYGWLNRVPNQFPTVETAPYVPASGSTMVPQPQAGVSGVQAQGPNRNVNITMAEGAVVVQESTRPGQTGAEVYQAVADILLNVGQGAA
jgi:hypothetical protein